MRVDRIVEFIVALAMGMVCLAFAYTCQGRQEPSASAVPAVGERLEVPSPADIQRLLNAAEPENPIKVDGRIGPETIAKWERIYCNQSAAKTFETNSPRGRRCPRCD